MPSLSYIPLLSSTLPPPSGPHAVGYAVVRAPAQPWSRPWPIFKSPSPRAGQPALQITRSTFALYYPTATLGGSVPWIPEPAAGVLAGYARYFGGGKWLARLLSRPAARYQVPVSPNAPLLPTNTPYPLVIFSHGICGTRTTYSQWAANLASEGYIVLAVEHADGSGPCVLLPDGELALTVMRELEWEPQSPDPSPSLTSSGSSTSSSLAGFGKRKHTKTEADLRALQLDQRVRELYAAHAALSALPSASVDGLDEAGARTWAAAFASGVDTTRPALAGHSFGASTVFRALESPPPDYAPLPISAALALDHWWEPFPPLGTRPAPTPTPTLAINSQEYTQAPQWPHILADCRSSNATLVTIVGTNHESFCDFAVIVTASLGTNLGYIDTVHTLTLALLRGALVEALDGLGADEGEFTHTCFGGMAGRPGEVVVHLRAKEQGRVEEGEHGQALAPAPVQALAAQSLPKQ